MISEIYDRVVRSQRAILLSQNDFESLHEMYGFYEVRTGPTLLAVKPEDLTEALTWLGDEDDISLTTDPASLVEHRLECLGPPDGSQMDSLTGLLDYAAFENAIQQLDQIESRKTCSVILCNVDNFEQLIATLGKQQSDEALIAIAKTIIELQTETDLAARIGNAEFVILCERDQEESLSLAERIRSAVECFSPRDQEVTLSVGVATEAGLPGNEIVRQASEALCAAQATRHKAVLHYNSLPAYYEQTGLNPLSANFESRSGVLSGHVADTATQHTDRSVSHISDEGETDSLSQFYTRRYLDRRLAREVEDTRVPMCIAFVDVDQFETINEIHGAPCGDQVLREVCDLIRAQLRDSDWVGRYGNEKFCLVMQNTLLSEALPVLERLRKTIEERPFLSMDEQPIEVTLSIGAVESTSDDGFEQLLERASQRNLDAKKSGRNRVST